VTLKAGRSERKDASLLCWSIETRFAARSCACALVDVSTCMPPRPVRQQTGQTADRSDSGSGQRSHRCKACARGKNGVCAAHGRRFGD
jgi:hypothetical protein